MTAEHDFECFHNGNSEKPRPSFICLGHGAFRRFPFVDGIGSLCLNQLILVQGTDGRFRLLDYEQDLGDHKSLRAIIGIMGFSTDKELLSFLIHGSR